MLNITIKEIKSKLQWGITSHWSELLLFSHSVMSDSCNPMDCSTPGFPVLHYPQSLLKLMSIESVSPSNRLILCHPLLLPSVLPSIRVFSSELALHIRWPKYRSFSFSTSPSSEIFRTGFLQDGLVGSPCSPRETQESSLTPHFKRINSSVLSFLYSPNLPSIHDYWNNHSFD